METHQITENTPLGILTVGQFKEIMSDYISEKESIPVSPSTKKDEVYGLRGIRNLFNVSEATAQRYKNTFLAPAVSQNGRKLVINVEMARDLFKQSGTTLKKPPE